jgi:outer membrane protein assembly factor BamB
MRPVIAGERIFMRRLTRHGPEIVCLETATGKLLWSRRPGDHVASDPLVVQEDLFVLSVTIPQAGILHVSLVALDPQTGETLAENMLLQLRDVWSRQVPCDAVAVNDKIVATIGGSVLSCDLFGQPRWLRRQTWLPPAQEPSFFTQHRNPPLVAGRRVYVTQPGVLTVDCLDLESGRLLWQQVVPDIRRVLGLIQNRLIVESNAGLQALDAETGAPQWYYPAETLLEAALCGGPGGILCAGREELKPNLRRPCLVWLNPETGSEIGRAPLGGFTDKNPLLGPFLAHGDRLWAGMSLNERDPRRQFIELVPAGPAAPGAAIDPFLIRWTNHVDPQFQLEVAETLPGWTALTQPPADHKAGLQPEQNGERDILLTRTSKERATVFARRVALRASGHPKLLVKAGVEPGHHWQLSIRVNNQTVLNKIVEPVTSNVWQELEVDLTAYAGQTVWLTVSQYPLAPAVGVAYWRRLDVVD